MYVQNRNSLIDIENKLVVAIWEREVGKGSLGVGNLETQTII